MLLKKDDIVRLAIEAGKFSEHGLPENLPFLMKFSDLVIRLYNKNAVGAKEVEKVE